MIWIAAATWMFLAGLILLFFYAADGGRWMWLHTRWPIHKQRLARAELCLASAKHWGNDEYITRRFLAEAYRLCADCGCPVDMWPADVIAIHVGEFSDT